MDAPRYNLTKYQGKTIAIDGPAGSGKSTTARLVAAQLGYKYLDTGAMYRALTLFALRHGVDTSDGDKLSLLASKLLIEFDTHENINLVYINGEDVTDAIRDPEVTRHVSEVSAHQGVRQAMVAQQREIGKKGSVVAEGRDTTTVVFPNAQLKIYLQASMEERAQRRMIDLSRMNIATSKEDQMADIQRRDEYDSKREHSPLKKAPDAHVIDTSQCTIDEQVERVLKLFRSIIK
jgi:cytidylate kinase